MTKQIELEEDLGSGLTYLEETSRSEHSYPARDCWLRQAGVAEPISGLNILAFRQRFGAVSVPAEGIGGVETMPAFRRQGHIRTLLTKTVEGMARRVPVAFVSDAIEGLYEKFGFVTCLVEAHLSVRVRHVERLAGSSLEGSSRVRGFAAADLPAMVALYNQAHARRTWTHERHAAWNHLFVTETWKSGSEVLIFERDGQVAGYAILRELQYGHVRSQFAVDELAAGDIEAAQVLLAEVAARCWNLRLSEFWVREPLDSAVGWAAQRIGCEYHQTFPSTGGMMGAILDRQQLLTLLEPELRRRLPSAELHTEHTAAFDALQRGELLADNRDLLRLLIGYWSAAHARAYDLAIPAQYERIAGAWFPGAGTHMLSLPYAHTLDRY
ncbi:MAG TPA: GNAT family N-acetyltransferase [Roseiflexaceae bacterium]|nr:GNAT family N-acetyltransferase [Roseiflexaceae bacterium]